MSSKGVAAKKLGLLSIFLYCLPAVKADDDCYGVGSLLTFVGLSIVLTILVIGAILYWLRRRPRTEHLILETDPEKGKSEYAFDNPGFKDAGLMSNAKITAKQELEKNDKQKWNNWHGFSAVSAKSDKKGTSDDSTLENGEVKVVALQSLDFTGLGFNICGNMKEGIFIKDILHKGPAQKSGKLAIGDRIHSVTISFDNIVYEDALKILSYASPYEVIIEARTGKIPIGTSSKNSQPCHPLYRSSSNTDLQQDPKTSRSKSEISLCSTFSTPPTIQNGDTNKATTIELTSQQHLESNQNSEKLQNNSQIAKTVIEPEDNKRNEERRVEMKTQKSENQYKKFGVKVFPMPENQDTPKSTGTSVTDATSNRARNVVYVEPDAVDHSLQRNNDLTGSGLKRDANGIPQEIPSHMLNAAFAARRNRGSMDEEDVKVSNKKPKGKAPLPPSEEADKDNDKREAAIQNEEYNSDSEGEVDLKSSINTIELDSKDIIVHHEENQEKQTRKTASTGDLTKIERISNSATLERAQSLEITDSGSKDRKPDQEDEDSFGKFFLNKEPRLSLILDGLSTFQRKRLRKSTEWGNLEDAILRSNQDDNDISIISTDDTSIGEKSAELDALVNKINEIRKEPVDIKGDGVKNEIWPKDFENPVEIKVSPVQVPKRSVTVIQETPKYEEKVQNIIWPVGIEETRTSVEKVSDDKENQQGDSIPMEMNVFEENKSIELEAPPEEIYCDEEDKILESSVLNEKLSNGTINSIPSQERVNLPPMNFYDLSINRAEDTETITQNSKNTFGELKETPKDSETGELFVEINNTDESKTFTVNDRVQLFKNLNEDFLMNERLSSLHQEDTNVPDDIKVSRHSLGSLERKISTDSHQYLPSLGNVTISSTKSENGSPSLHSLEFTINESDTNKIEKPIEKTMGPISITTPDLIKNASITEAINTLNNVSDIKLKSDDNTNTSLTYITEIQVTTNTPPIENTNNPKTSEDDFGNYVKKFEIEQSTDVETAKENNKIQEIAREQLRKLPEMRFRTSTYESSTPPEKRQSQIELLKSNFEKSPPKSSGPKSRIPISMTMKTPPTSPERRDSRGLDAEDVFEMLTNLPKPQKTPVKNVTVTSIRNNSKIPSGLPVLGGNRSKKTDQDNDSLQVVNNNSITFKQWVFDPVSSVTNISLPGQKQE